MPNLRNFLIMSKFVAAELLTAMEGREGPRFEPVEIRGGPHKGDFVIAIANRSNPLFADLFPRLSMLDIVTLDTEIAFPRIVEEE